MGDRAGWIVCLACITNIFIRGGLIFGFGAFIAEFEQLYQRPMAELDWIAALSVTLSGILSPLADFIINKIGKNGYSISSFIGTLMLASSCFTSALVDNLSWLFLTFSFLAGLGSSLLVISSTLIVYEFFPSSHRYHVSATTAYQYSFPLGIMTFSSLFAWIIKVTSWRVAFGIAGVVMIVFGAISSLVFFVNKAEPQEVQRVNGPKEVVECNSENKNKLPPNDCLDSKWTSICSTPKRFFWLVGIMLTFAIQSVPVFNLTHYMESRKYGKLESSMPLVMGSFFQIPTLLVFSSIGNYIKGKLIYINVVSCLLLGLVFTIWAFVDPTYAVILVFSSVLGVLATLSLGFISPTSMESMSMKINISWTATCASSGIGSLLSPFLSGAIYDIRHSYDDIFLVIGISSFLNSLIFAMIPLIDVIKKKRDCYESLK